MIRVKMTMLCAAATGLIVASTPAISPVAAASFYEGKQITFYIGSSPGGGYNRYARTVGHHIGKYIPGHPNIVFVNMPAPAAAS